MHEFELINKYLSKLSIRSKGSLNLNDDVFFDKTNKLVVSVDTYVEGNHFFNFKNPDLVIKKIIRSSISDLICKGVKPKYYFLSGSGSRKVFTKNNLAKISKSLKEDLILSHLDKLFQVIIKCAVFEFLYKPKTSSKIIIKEYLNASNFFLDDSQTKYLNALLDKISRKIRTTDA